MAFFECEFPREIGYVAAGGDGFQTQVNSGMSGKEQRNRDWSQSRRKFQIPLNGKPKAYFDLVRAFFLNVGGKADAFRFYWHLDHSIENQQIGVGNGVLDTFQLIKTYTVGSRTYTYPITKPIMSTVENFEGGFLTDTVKIKVDGVLLTHGSQWTVDTATGIVTFASPPADTKAITADGDFHIKVRFDNDDMSGVQILSPDLTIKWPNVQLIEEK